MTPEQKLAFIAALLDMQNVREAATHVGVHPRIAYLARESDANFLAVWKLAEVVVAQRIEAEIERKLAA